MSSSTAKQQHAHLRSILESKKMALEIKRKKKIRRSNKILISLGLIVIIFLSNAFYFKNTILLNNHEFLYFIMSILLGLSLVTRSIGDEDQVFLKIMESLELIDISEKYPEFCKEAAEKLDDATSTLEQLLEYDEKRVIFSWYSNIKKLEKDFISKLKYRAVPALREGDLIRPLSKKEDLLLNIALVFTESNTNQMKTVNEVLDGYDEIQPNGKDKISLMSFSRFRSGKISSLIITIIIGFVSISIITFTYCLFTIHSFIDLISDPKYFILGGLAVSALITTFFTSVKDTSELSFKR